MQFFTRIAMAPLALTLILGVGGGLGGCDERPDPLADDLQPIEREQMPTPIPEQREPLQPTPSEQPIVPHHETDPERDTTF
jgi:hypothetical protein